MFSFTAYNFFCAAGWAYVWFLTVKSAVTGKSANALWNSVQEPLKLVQTLVTEMHYHVLNCKAPTCLYL